MIGILDGVKIGAGGVTGAILMWMVSASILQPAAYERGREAERAASLERSIEVIKERSRTNETVRNLDTAGICAALGGVYAEGECR